MDEAVTAPSCLQKVGTARGSLVLVPNKGEPLRLQGSRTSVPLYGLFTMTGVGTALLGATLPALLVHWRLSDGKAGLLFLLMFVASSTGSLVSRAASAKRAGAAGLVLAVCCGALALAHGWEVFPLTAAYGLGIGFSISTVTRVRLVCPPGQRVSEVNRLNFVWGLGAFLCPSVANELIRHYGVRSLFLLLAAVFMAGGAWILIAAASDKMAATAGAPLSLADDESGTISLPVLAAAGAFLAVGVESSLGAWLATYAHRLESGFAAPVEATTLFWLGLLASRALCSTSLVRGMTHTRLLLSLLSLTAAGCVALMAVQRGSLLLAVALVIGFGIGPVFPMLLAAVLPRVRGNAIFVIAGVGASALPWTTGEISGRYGSLRMGMAASALAGVALLAMGPWLARELEGMQTRLPNR